jgi:hypothetical protein
MLKKIIVSILFLAASMGWATYSRAGIILTAVPSVLGGNHVSVGITVSGLGYGTALGSFDIDIGFDSAMLIFTGAAFGDPVLGDQLDLSGLSINSPTATPGAGNVNLLEASFDDPSMLLSGQAHQFTLATLSFAALASGFSTVSVAVNGLGDANGNPLSATTVNALIAVNSSALPLPGSVPLLLVGLLAWLPWRRPRESQKKPTC